MGFGQRHVGLAVYSTAGGAQPFDEWVRSLPDLRVRAAVARRLARLRTGVWGDARAVGGGVLELKLHLGPGYRIYLGRDTDETVVLLWGGHKGTQARDLARARAFWADHLLRA